MALAHSPKIVTSGLVLCLDAANAKSYPGTGTTWTDLSGNANTGTLANGPTYSSDNGGGIVLDGTNDEIQFSYGSSLNIGGLNLTLSVWIKSLALANSLHGAGVLVRESGANDGLYEILLTQTSSKNYTFFRINGAGNYNPALTPIELNEIYNIVCIYDNGTMKIYVNGEQEGLGSSKNVNITTNNARTIKIGRRFTTTSSMFTGNVYQASIYNKALTEAEIRQNFNALRGRYGI